MVVLAAELSGLCGKILARLDQGKYATGKLPSGILPCPNTVGLSSLLLAWGMDPRHLTWPASAWSGPSSSPPWGHSLFILPSSPSTRHCPGTLSSPLLSLALYFLVPFYLLGRGRGEGTGKKRFTLSWGEGGVTVITVCFLPLARGRLNKERNSALLALLRTGVKDSVAKRLLRMLGIFTNSKEGQN